MVDDEDAGERETAAEFDQLRRRLTAEGATDTPQIEFDEAAENSGDPTQVAFSDDEIDFATLIADDGLPAGAAGKREEVNAFDRDSKPVLETLVEELAQDVTEAEVEALRERLCEGEPATSVEVRLEHLESQFERFAAYTDALEAFLDENGTADQLIDELRAELREVNRVVTTLQDTVQAAAADRATLRERLEAVEGETAETTAAFADLEHAIERVERTSETERADTKARLETIQTTLDEHERVHQRLQAVFVDEEPT
ncbi:hypothetical protein ACFQGT_20540 [Natrialbaceae archaeon GCM10025810]